MQEVFNLDVSELEKYLFFANDVNYLELLTLVKDMRKYTHINTIVNHCDSISKLYYMLSEIAMDMIELGLIPYNANYKLAGVNISCGISREVAKRDHDPTLFENLWVDGFMYGLMDMDNINKFTHYYPIYYKNTDDKSLRRYAANYSKYRFMDYLGYNKNEIMEYVYPILQNGDSQCLRHMMQTEDVSNILSKVFS